MPEVRNHTAAPLGVLLALVMSIVIYWLDMPALLSIVTTTYMEVAMVSFEAAWLLATLDHLLNLNAPLPRLLWIVAIILLAFTLRHPASSSKAVAAFLLTPAITWMIFAYKYAALPLLGFPFLIWRILLPLILGLAITGILSLPFWLLTSRRTQIGEKPKSIRFTCQSCGAEYRSNPLICVKCGARGTIKRNYEETERYAPKY